eukprot:TRINITY_DN3671_c0_g1_i2.p1 TRINITY_DN3671_c0_g1~~TRINITY_DN3671_c0_g1_i2.p1  ORF type:complete len:285 (-),score=100.54 TRINITY_DN3671_c0_g1_i2:737-1591(-)
MSSSCSEDDVVRQVEPDFIWDTKSELALFQVMLYHKPAGINKHFNVALAAELISDQIGVTVQASAIWKKLQTMFHLKAVDDIEESIPFSLEIQDFSLPRQDFETLILERQRDWRHDKTRSRYFSSGGTPSTPKSEGSESRSSPVGTDDEDELDSDVISDDDEDFDLDLESNKSDVKDGDLDNDIESESEKDKEKEQLISQAREEFEKKLKVKQKEEEKARSTVSTTPNTATTTTTTTTMTTTASTPKSSAKVEPKTPTVDAPKRHMTRSTPTTTPSSTPNKRRK